MVEEVGRLFSTWADTKRLLEMVNQELRAHYQQYTEEFLEINCRLGKVNEELNNIRCAVKAGLDDLDGANQELRRLKREQEDLQVRQRALGTEPEVPQVDLALVADYQRRFTEVFARGTNEEKRTVARCFVKKIEVDPDTGNVLMYLFSRPPAATIPQKSIGTPPKSRASIGLVAGAGFEPATFGL